MPSPSVEFVEYPQPEWNAPGSVTAAIESVIRARDKDTSSSAYNKFLYSIGNNHAGTYYPVVLAVVPRLESILRDGSPWPQRTVLEALIDLFTSFEPEVAHETFQGLSLSATLRERILALKQYVEPLAKTESVANKSAQDLLDCFDEKEV
jgi:hypothetical protein